MAVVINEFETVPAAPAGQERGGAAESGGEDQPSPPSEYEIQRMVELQASRNERVRAY